jgi:acyl-homoserine lactone acylase PvdQ
MRAKDLFAPEDVLEIHHDMVSPIKRDLVKLGYHLRDIQQYPLADETRKVLEYLEHWRDSGYKSDMSIKGTEILNLMPMAFRQNFAAAITYGGGISGLCNMLQTLDARIAENASAVLTEEEADYVNLILRAAWRYGTSRYGDDPNQWNAKARQELLETPLPYMSTLDGFGSLDEDKDVTFPALRCIEGGTILSQRAQSYTQYVPMHDPDQAQALLPIGSSEHPDSPYRLAGYELWGQGRLRPAPLSREAVDKVAVSQVILEPSKE